MDLSKWENTYPKQLIGNAHTGQSVLHFFYKRVEDIAVPYKTGLSARFDSLTQQFMGMYQHEDIYRFERNSFHPLFFVRILIKVSPVQMDLSKWEILDK